jgi:transposase
VLYLALDLGASSWTLAFSVGLGQKPRIKTITARSTLGLVFEIRAAKKRFGLPEDAPVVCCYDAGRDGFWLHRFLLAEGIQNQVVDSSSIEVNRRRRRAKSDSLDAAKLVEMLIRDGFAGSDPVSGFPLSLVRAEFGILTISRVG